MASDVWGFSKTFVVFIYFLIVGALTTDTDEQIDSGTIAALSSEFFYSNFPLTSHVSKGKLLVLTLTYVDVLRSHLK